MDNFQENQERRSFERFRARLPLKIVSDDQEFSVETKDISCGGFNCRSKLFVPVLTKLEVSMSVPLIKQGRKISRRIDCQVVVVRTDPESERESVAEYELGCFFIQIEEKDRKIISEYLQQIFCASRN